MRVLGTLLLVVLAAGCGATHRPTLQRADAAELIALAHRIAGEGACGQARDIPRLRNRVTALVNGGRVPAELQEPLMSAIGAIGEKSPVCLPPVTASLPTTTTVTPPPPAPKRRHGHDHGKGDKHGKGDEQ